MEASRGCVIPRAGDKWPDPGTGNKMIPCTSRMCVLMPPLQGLLACLRILGLGFEISAMGLFQWADIRTNYFLHVVCEGMP